MDAVREKLIEYRKRKKTSFAEANARSKPESDEFQPANDEIEIDASEEVEEAAENVNRMRFFDFWAVDFLNLYPFRVWRKFCEKFPLQCWIATGCVWATGQLLFIQAEFGLVYFLLSLFTLMFLNLGVRKEGELSAYSVFNPNCERLLGQITNEHFERDVLMRR